MGPHRGLPPAGRGPGTYSLPMRLLGVPDASGKPTIWINADHLVSVQPVARTGAHSIELAAELKVDGMPLLRINLGEHPDRESTDAAFENFLERLQS